jgi:hypothetical protein
MPMGWLIVAMLPDPLAPAEMSSIISYALIFNP